MPDGARHVYDLTAGTNGRWRGKIIYIALEPPRGRLSSIALDWIKTMSEPAGDPEPWVERFFVTDALPRAGNVCTAVTRVSNRGGGVVRGARLALVLPEGVRLAESEAAEKLLAAVTRARPHLYATRSSSAFRGVGLGVSAASMSGVMASGSSPAGSPSASLTAWTLNAPIQQVARLSAGACCTARQIKTR